MKSYARNRKPKRSALWTRYAVSYRALYALMYQRGLLFAQSERAD